MVTIHPFRAIRPAEALAEKVATLPYDVLNSAEARALASGNPESYLHIDKPEIDLPEDTDPYSPAVYAKAAENLEKFRANGWLIEDRAPELYLYELTMDGRAQTGLVACTSVAEYLRGEIKKHEFTRPEKEKDRIEHIKACNANTSPIFLTYRGKEAINTLLEKWKTTHVPLYDFDSFHDVHHRVWPIDETDVIARLTEEFTQVPALYIADGHHRTASAIHVAEERIKAGTDTPETHFFLSVLFPKEELKIWDYNRILNVALPEDFFAQLEKSFSLEKAKESPTLRKGQFGMYLNGIWYLLTYKTPLSGKLLDDLDVSILQRQIFENIFAINDIRTDPRIDFVGGIRGVAELEKQVDSGNWNLAFSLFPTSMDELLAVADADEIMPPKSTWFEPKLLSGLFLHSLN